MNHWQISEGQKSRSYLPTKDQKVKESNFLVTFWHTGNVHFRSTQFLNGSKYTLFAYVLSWSLYQVISFLSDNCLLMANLDCSPINHILNMYTYSDADLGTDKKTDLDKKSQLVLSFDLVMTGKRNWIWPLGQNQAMVIMRIDIISKYGKRDGGCLAC